jgi:hypothetical protein
MELIRKVYLLFSKLSSEYKLDESGVDCEPLCAISPNAEDHFLTSEIVHKCSARTFSLIEVTSVWNNSGIEKQEIHLSAIDEQCLSDSTFDSMSSS